MSGQLPLSASYSPPPFTHPRHLATPKGVVASWRGCGGEQAAN